MNSRRIILAFIPQFLREALKRVIDKSASLHLAAIVDDPHRLLEVIEETDAEWVILPLMDNGKLNNNVDELLRAHPKTRFLAISPDVSLLKVRSLEPHDEEFMEMSLDELVAVLRRHASYS